AGPVPRIARRPRRIRPDARGGRAHPPRRTGLPEIRAGQGARHLSRRGSSARNRAVHRPRTCAARPARPRYAAAARRGGRNVAAGGSPARCARTLSGARTRAGATRRCRLMGRLVPAATRALDILELFLDDETLSAPEIVAALHLPRTTVHELVATLVTRSYLVAEEGGRYRLGVRTHQ